LDARHLSPKPSAGTFVTLSGCVPQQVFGLVGFAASNPKRATRPRTDDVARFIPPHERRKGAAPYHSDTVTPAKKTERRVSIVVPAYNAEATIEAALRSLVAQQSPVQREIIVVDDGSTDRTAAIAAAVDGVRVMSQPNAGPAVARNNGVEAASGEFVLFIDSDCEASPDWLNTMLEPFADGRVAGVKGAYRTRQTALAARFAQLEYEDKYDRMARREFIDFVDTYSAAFRREVFSSSGGYSPEFPTACAEDVDLSYRMERAGAKMVFRPQAIVYHRHPERLGAYLRKKFRFAMWRVLAVKRNPEKLIADSHTPQLMKVQALAAPAVAALAVASPVLPYAGLASAVLGGAFAASTLPFTVKALRKDRAVGAVAPPMLFLRGLAQGAGLAAGALRLLRPAGMRSPATAVASGASDRSIG
jgi:GT2 family glycosyltransferase